MQKWFTCQMPSPSGNRTGIEREEGRFIQIFRC